MRCPAPIISRFGAGAPWTRNLAHHALMRSIFSPELVNGPSGDPALYVDFRFEPRALLLDLGDLHLLPPKKILRISDVFVSHTHMDHFCGFDRLLRICLGRDTGLRLYGPPGFIAQVEHKLAAYTWNLVERYPGDFVIEAWEMTRVGGPTDGDCGAASASGRSRSPHDRWKEACCWTSPGSACAPLCSITASPAWASPSRRRPTSTCGRTVSPSWGSPWDRG